MQIMELRVCTRELATHRAFYATTLGLPILDEVDSSFTVRVGASRLVFEQAARDNTPYHIAFTIPRHTLGSAKRWLAARTPLLTDQDGRDEFAFTSWDAHAVYFGDPAGNIMELIARHTLPNDAPGAFGPDDLLCVSEIGLPVDDVSARAATLVETLDFTYYQEHSDGFAPLGNADGLLIVVAVGRPWFPTGTPASVAPIALILSGPDERHYQVPELPYDITIMSRESP